MSLLILALINQLSFFEFVSYPSNGVAGDSFEITVVAKDASGDTAWYFSDLAGLATTRDGRYHSVYVYPNQLVFRRGVATGKVIVTLAETLSLFVYSLQRPEIRGYTPTIRFEPNFPKKLLLLLPGESLVAGSKKGKYPDPPLPNYQIAGISFFVEVFVTDEWSNPTLTPCTILVTSTDSFATLPRPSFFPPQRSLRLPITLRTAKSSYLYCSPISFKFKTDTSSRINVLPGPYSKILLLLPGESLLPGDTTSLAYLTPGKTGTPLPAYIKTNFFIKVYACDNYYNPTSCPRDSILLFSDFSFKFSPSFLLLQDSGEFVVQFDSAGENQTLWAFAHKINFSTYRSRVNILSKAHTLQISKPDTLLAGEIGEIKVRVLDINNKPIIYRPVTFAVICGQGKVLDSIVITDINGWAKSRFVCDYPNFGEVDTILITVDDKKEKIRIYIDAKSKEILAGRIIGFPNPVGVESDTISFMYFLRKSANLTFSIYDPFGNLVINKKVKAGNDGARLGVNRLTWDGRDQYGKKVASGLYYVKITAFSHTSKIFDSSYRVLVVW